VTPTPAILREIVDNLRKHRSFCVVGHVRPDGDCVGSQLAVALALRSLGKTVRCWNEDPLPEKLAFLDPKRIFATPPSRRRWDCVIATDAASFERLGKLGPLIQNRKVFINIDHHQSNTRYGDLNWVSAKVPSTGELVFQLLRYARWDITSQIADCLFTAISTDTGSFQYPTTLPETYRTAAELVTLGANLSRICNEVYQSYPLSRVRLLQHVYNRFRLTHRNRIAYCWLKKSDYTRTGACSDESEGLIDHIRAIEPVVVACMFEEVEPNLTRVSFRSKSDRIDVNRIASEFGGGGHSAAAGARIPGSPIAAQRRVISAIRKALDAAHLSDATV